MKQLCVQAKVCNFTFGLAAVASLGKRRLIFLTTAWWMLFKTMLQVWNKSAVACFLAGCNEIAACNTPSMEMFVLPCGSLSSPAIWKQKLLHFMMVHLDVHQVHAASLKLIWDSILSTWDNEICVYTKSCNSTFGLLWLIREEEPDLPHSMLARGPHSTCCKFKINRSLLIIWLVEITYTGCIYINPKMMSSVICDWACENRASGHTVYHVA